MISFFCYNIWRDTSHSTDHCLLTLISGENNDSQLSHLSEVLWMFMGLHFMCTFLTCFHGCAGAAWNWPRGPHSLIVPQHLAACGDKAVGGAHHQEPQAPSAPHLPYPPLHQRSSACKRLTNMHHSCPNFLWTGELFVKLGKDTKSFDFFPHFKSFKSALLITL